jgi:hypothetical protein
MSDITIDMLAERAASAMKTLTNHVSESLDAINAEGGKAPDLIALYRRIYDADETLTEALKVLGKQKDHLKFKALPEAFDAQGISTLTTATKDRVTITQAVRASILAANRDVAYKWLQDNGHGSIISTTVNASTLSSFAKHEMEAGNSLPEEFFNVAVVSQAALTRGK